LILKFVSLGCGAQLRQVGVLTERGFRALCAKVWFAVIFLKVLLLHFNTLHSRSFGFSLLKLTSEKFGRYIIINVNPFRASGQFTDLRSCELIWTSLVITPNSSFSISYKLNHLYVLWHCITY